MVACPNCMWTIPVLLRKDEHVDVSSASTSINLQMYWITISTTFLQQDHPGCGLEELQSDTSGKHHGWQGCCRYKLGGKYRSRETIQPVIQQEKEIPLNNNFFWITFLEWGVIGRNCWRRLFSDCITLHYQREPEKGFYPESFRSKRMGGTHSVLQGIIKIIFDGDS